MGLFLGIMLNFHYTALIFIPVIISLAITGYLKLKRKDSVRFFSGFILPSLPLLIYDSTHNFKMIGSLLIWIPFRIIGFVGFYPKNTVSVDIIKTTFSSFYHFINLSFLPPGYLLAFIIIFILIAFIILKVRQPLILFWLGWGTLCLFIHGAPPIHYFLVLFPLPIIIASLFLVNLTRIKYGVILLLLILSTVVYTNLVYFFLINGFICPRIQFGQELTMYLTIYKRKLSKPLLKTPGDEHIILRESDRMTSLKAITPKTINI